MSDPTPTPEKPTGWIFSPDEEKLRQHIADCDAGVLFERQGSGQHAWYKCSSCGVLIRHAKRGEEVLALRTRCTGKPP